MSLVKYMGTADIRRLEKGEDFSGRLAEPITSDLEWSRDNRFIIDTDEAGLSPEAVELLLSEPDFKDVTDLKRIPTSLHEQIYGGLPPEDDPSTPEDESAGDAVQTETVTGEKSGSQPVGGGTATGGGTARGGRTTTGGSTGGTTTTGGSTPGPA